MFTRKNVDVDKLKEVFRLKNSNLERINYRYPNGKWTVVESKNNTNNGYCFVSFNKGVIQYHVIVWVLTTGEDIPKGMEIDHINGNKIDNRIENLRLVNRRENTQNKKIHRQGKLPGCYYHKQHNKFMSAIQIYGEHIYIGYFATEKKAHQAYKIACENINLYNDRESFRTLIKGLLLQEKV